MWKFYFNEIFKMLFLPYVVYMLSFTIYASFMAVTPWNEMNLIGNMLRVICLIVFFPLWAYFVNVEYKQGKDDPTTYV